MIYVIYKLTESCYWISTIRPQDYSYKSAKKNPITY